MNYCHCEEQFVSISIVFWLKATSQDVWSGTVRVWERSVRSEGCQRAWLWIWLEPCRWRRRWHWICSSLLDAVVLGRMMRFSSWSTRNEGVWGMGNVDVLIHCSLWYGCDVWPLKCPATIFSFVAFYSRRNKTWPCTFQGSFAFPLFGLQLMQFLNPYLEQIFVFQITLRQHQFT